MSEPTPAELARLSAGEVLIRSEDTGGAPQVEARGLIAAPPERVWALIDDVSGYSRFMPRVKRSRELSRVGDVIEAESTIEMPFPLKNLSAVTRGVHTVVPGERWVRAWQLLRGDYVRNEGSWTLVPFPGRDGATLVTYRLAVQLKVPLPGKIQQAAQQKTLPQVIEALRKAV